MARTHRSLSEKQLKISAELFREFLRNNNEKPDPRVEFLINKSEKELESFNNLSESTTEFPVPKYEPNDIPINYSCDGSSESEKAGKDRNGERCGGKDKISLCAGHEKDLSSHLRTQDSKDNGSRPKTLVSSHISRATVIFYLGISSSTCQDSALDISLFCSSFLASIKILRLLTQPVISVN
ncbi:hypothetical protein KQX54_012496 [Cotesia glomerata]|uniref:Uncharacterized protein n=1 Tax=Cotesia glomerata TaxID=32391 RepID=A0AAV7J1G8_COTGL|nr:hypothetical protein KQX54_012496 [Cotesia glomerata]